jgi:hypothetical protein
MAIGLLKVSKGFNVPRFRLKHRVKKKVADGKRIKSMYSYQVFVPAASFRICVRYIYRRVSYSSAIFGTFLKREKLALYLHSPKFGFKV